MFPPTQTSGSPLNYFVFPPLILGIGRIFRYYSSPHAATKLQPFIQATSTLHLLALLQKPLSQYWCFRGPPGALGGEKGQ